MATESPMHTLIIGSTGMGKTLCAKRILAGCVARVPCLAYDPQAGGRDAQGLAVPVSGYGLAGWPKKCWVSSDLDAFNRVFWASQGCAVVLDECLDPAVKDGRDKIELMLTQGRHKGHTCYMLAQTIAYLNPTARRMCNAAFIFRNNDGENIARHFGDRRLGDLSRRLNVREYVHVDGMGALSRGIVKV